MFSDPSQKDRTMLYALVSYIPEPLAGFLDRLRRDLVPHCFLRAHITILPPRPSSTSPEIAWAELSEGLSRCRPFDVELRSVELFHASDVIYVSIGQGEQRLKEMHDALNIGRLHFQEPFTFHPHVTLAQELATDEVDELFRAARKRWDEFKFDRVFHVDQLTFVQSANRKKWHDLAHCKLGFQPPLEPLAAIPDQDQLVHS